MALGFLSLPAEIRNHIYSYLFPTPENPQAFKVYPRDQFLVGDAADVFDAEECVLRELDTGSYYSQQGTPRLDYPFGLCCSCITIYEEVPSADSLVMSGAIIPTIDPYQLRLNPELIDDSHNDLVQKRRFKRFMRAVVRAPRLRFEPDEEQHRLASLVSLSESCIRPVGDWVDWILDEWLYRGEEYMQTPIKTLEVQTTNSMISSLLKQIRLIGIGEGLQALNVKFYRPDGGKPTQKEWKKIENNFNDFIEAKYLEHKLLSTPSESDREDQKYEEDLEEEKYLKENGYLEEEEYSAGEDEYYEEDEVLATLH